VNKFNPPFDSGTLISVCFPYGDFRRVKSIASGQDEFQITVDPDGAGNQSWYTDHKIHNWLLHVAGETQALVQVRQDGKERQGIAPGTTLRLMKIQHTPPNGGRAFSRWVCYPDPVEKPDWSYDTLTFRAPTWLEPQGTTTSTDTPPPPTPTPTPEREPTSSTDTPPPPTEERTNGNGEHDRDHPNDTPGGSAPPRIIRHPYEIVALMDRAVYWAELIAKKYKPNIAHVDTLAIELFRSNVIGGIRLDAEHYGRIVDELRGDFAKDDDTTPTDQLPEGGSA